MDMKKLLSLVLALALMLGVAALAESEDLQAALDAANERIAALEAEVEKYKPFYDQQIIAEYGEDGIVWKADVEAQYQEAAAMYAQYGIPVDDYAAEIKQSIVEGMVQDGVLDAKAAELGIGQPDEDTLADLTAKAQEDFETYVSYYTSYFATEGAIDEENRQATIDGLNGAGISADSLLNDRLESYASEQLHDYVTKDVTVTDEDVQAKYQEMIEADKEDYADDYNYISAKTSGDATIAWNPEGYRTVKHVLVKFSDDQASQYNDLHSALDSLNDELAALDEAENAETTDEAAETENAEAADDEAEPEEPPRTREEIQTDIGTIGASLEALYSELMPKAQEVVDAFNGGKDFDSLIAEYGEDPGMQAEPGATEGYPVAEGVTYWDPAFTEGAMSIPEIGQISEPVRGQNGIHIIYYLADITPGDVPFEEIKDGVEAAALESKISDTYDAQVQAWVEEANATYHMENLD